MLRTPHKSLQVGSKDSKLEPVFSGYKIIYNDDPLFSGKPGTPKLVNCEFCGAVLRTKGLSYGDVIWGKYPEECTCLKASEKKESYLREKESAEAAEIKRQADIMLKRRIDRIFGASGMGARFMNRTFETFQITVENEKAFMIAKEYAESFENNSQTSDYKWTERNGLFIAGPSGTGKTHLAAAIANIQMRKGIATIFMTQIDLLERIKRTYSSGDIDEHQVLRIYTTVPLLIIDDLGKEVPTEWAVSVLYKIINARYESLLPVIITSNYGSNDLIGRLTPSTTKDSRTAAATLDRLLETCRGIAMDGQSWRIK